MWNQNGGEEASYHPPMTPEKYAQAFLGFLEGTPVDAFVSGLGWASGYQVIYPTEVEGMEFIVDRIESDVPVGTVKDWQYAENVRRIWEAGCDPIQIRIDEARRLGIDYWAHLHMNDWHHLEVLDGERNILSSRFHEQRRDLLIGEEGTAGLPEALRVAMRWFQDYRHDEVRRLRLEVMKEACSRYDLDGFQYDFMRCPGYFRHGEEKASWPIMTGFMRESRRAIDGIAGAKGRAIGFAARVPNTIDGAERLGLDVRTWVGEGLVDILIPATLYAADLEEDIAEWVELARGTGVQIVPTIEAGYRAGHTGGVTRNHYHPPAILPLDLDMINAVAARHWRDGADGMYLFNFFGSAAFYGLDTRPALDDIGNPLRLKHKNKKYVVARSEPGFVLRDRDQTFPNCLRTERQIPVELTADGVDVAIDVADDLAEAGQRVAAAELSLLVQNLTICDELSVSFNGTRIEPGNPLREGACHRQSAVWQRFDLLEAAPPRPGSNTLSVRVARRNQRLAGEIPLELTDVELSIRYAFPNGPWEGTPD